MSQHNVIMSHIYFTLIDWFSSAKFEMFCSSSQTSLYRSEYVSHCKWKWKWKMVSGCQNWGVKISLYRKIKACKDLSSFRVGFTLINWVWALRFICFALCKWCQLLYFAFQMVSEFVKGCTDRYAMNHIVVREMLQSACTNVIDTHMFFKLISFQC